jgi:hypothetical protein
MSKKLKKQDLPLRPISNPIILCAFLADQYLDGKSHTEALNAASDELFSSFPLCDHAIKRVIGTKLFKYLKSSIDDGSVTNTKTFEVFILETFRPQYQTK